MSFSFMTIHDPVQRTKLEEIYAKYRKVMFYTAKSILNDDFSAEDAVHKAFEKLFNYLDKIEDISSHKTKGFLVIVVRNIAIDLYN